MASISSASSNAQVVAVYMDNCGYREDASASMASAFATACRAMLRRGVRRIEFAGEIMEFEPRVLRDLAREADVYAAADAGPAGGGSGVKHPDFRDFRE